MQEYTVVIAGQEHTLQLSDEDAKRYGDAAKPVQKGASAQTKSRTPQDK